MGYAVKNDDAETRLVRWEQDDTVVTMNFDRMGHRVEF
jgi:hypothetical protein